MEKRCRDRAGTGGKADLPTFALELHIKASTLLFLSELKVETPPTNKLDEG